MLEFNENGLNNKNAHVQYSKSRSYIVMIRALFFYVSVFFIVRNATLSCFLYIKNILTPKWIGVW